MPPQAQAQAAAERIRLKGPDGKLYTIPSTQSGAFLRTHPDYDLAGPPNVTSREQKKLSPFALSTGIDPSPGGVAKWEAKELGGGALDALKGVYSLAKPPEGTAESVMAAVPGALPLKRLAQGTLEPLGDIGQVPGALRDLYKSGYGKEALALQVPRAMGNLLTYSKLGKMAGSEAAKGTPAEITRNPTKPGSYVGAMTRGKQLMDYVDQAAKDIPVNWEAAYKWAQKALALEKYGTPAPAPVKAFVKLIDERMQPGMDPVSGEPGAMVDRGAMSEPLPYQDARGFEQSLGAKIDWDDPGGKMNALQKKMREALGTDTAKALRPYKLDAPYLRAKAELTKAYGLGGIGRTIGKIGGRVAGYGVGASTGIHPFVLGEAGSQAGGRIAGSMVESILNKGTKAAPSGETSAAAVPPDIAANSAKLIQRIRETQKAGPQAGPAPLAPNLQELWQQGAFGKQPTADVGAKVRAKNPEPPRTSTRAIVHKAAMRKLGYSDSVIDQMKPEQIEQIVRLRRPAISHERSE